MKKSLQEYLNPTTVSKSILSLDDGGIRGAIALCISSRTIKKTNQKLIDKTIETAQSNIYNPKFCDPHQVEIIKAAINEIKSM